MIIGYIQLMLEIAASLTALLFYKSLIKQGWFFLLPYLIYTCVVEVWATNLAINNVKNAWLYNPYIIISFSFYSILLIKSSLFSWVIQKTFSVIVIILTVAFGVWYLMFGKNDELINGILNITSLIISFLCILFYYTHLRNPSEYISITKIPGFWIATGLLVFYAGISVYSSIYPYLAETQIKIGEVPIQNLIPQILSLLLYSFIIISILRCRKFIQIQS